MILITDGYWAQVSYLISTVERKYEMDLQLPLPRVGVLQILMEIVEPVEKVGEPSSEER